MDYIASLAQRGLISPDVAQGLVQQVNDIRNKGPLGQPPIQGAGGRGFPVGGASGKPVVVPDPANQNKTPKEQFVDEYDALIRKKAAELNRQDFRTIRGDKSEK